MAWYKPWTWGDEASGRQALAEAKPEFSVPGYDARQERLLEDAGRYGGQAMSFLNSDFREDQARQMGRLERRATGQESIAGTMLGQAAGRNVAQQQALAQSARSGNVGLAQRQAMQNAGRINQGLAGQAALARLQEQQMVEGQLAGVTSGARGQDIGVGQAYLGAKMGLTALEQQQAALQQGGQIAYNQAMAGKPTGTQMALSAAEAAAAAAAAYGLFGSGGDSTTTTYGPPAYNPGGTTGTGGPGGSPASPGLPPITPPFSGGPGGWDPAAPAGMSSPSGNALSRSRPRGILYTDDARERMRRGR